MKHNRDRLIELIYKFTKDFTKDCGWDFFVDDISANAAVSFLKNLSDDYISPKIAPDDDGVLLVWETDNKVTMMSFVGDEVHVVDKAGTLKSKHFDPFLFDGVSMPDEILECLPKV